MSTVSPTPITDVIIDRNTGDIVNGAVPPQRNSAEERAAMAYAQELERARLDCQTYRSFSLEGNKFFGGGALVGGIFSTLSPNHWSTRRRALPFFALGVIGIVLDYFDTAKYCAIKFPNKFDTRNTQTNQLVSAQTTISPNAVQDSIEPR